MEAFKGAGGAVQATGMNYKDAAVALGILANNGVKGAEAGTRPQLHAGTYVL